MFSRVNHRSETHRFDAVAGSTGRRTPATPEEILASLPYGTKNWKAVLMSLINYVRTLRMWSADRSTWQTT